MPTDDLSLRLGDSVRELCAEAGNITLLTGPVGSGKSRWLQQLAGLAPLPKGITCKLHGRPWPDRKASIAVRLLPDLHPLVFLGQHVDEELAFGLGESPSQETLQQILERWSIGDIDLGCDVRSLNRLQAIRLSLAAMELAQPGLALLDNPVAALPAEDAGALCRDIRDWAERTQLVVVVACNRWQDWQPWAARTWRIDRHDALPVAEATGV